MKKEAILQIKVKTTDGAKDNDGDEHEIYFLLVLTV